MIPNNFSDPGQIFLYNCNHSYIFDINLFNSSTGLWIEKSNNITIDKCNFSDNIYSGLYIRNTFNTSILGSFFKNNSKYGLFYWSGNNYTIDNNTFKQNNNYGIYGYGQNNTIMRNEFNYNFHALSVSGKNYTISSNSAYKNDVSFLFFGDNYTIYNNSVFESSSYAFKFYGDYSQLKNNTAKSCGGDGFYLRYSNNELIDNQILNNKNGIYIHGGSNMISENKIKSNGNFGLITDTASSKNTIYNNTFDENNINAWDNGTDNNWDNGFIGNFWDDYEGIDYNDDGIGDNPYSIGGIADAKDFFPIFADGPNPPYLEVIYPINGMLFGETPPEFVIRIQDASLSKSWYNISDGDYVSPNIFFDTNGTINEDEWNRLLDGSVILNFYANDTIGNENWVSVEIFKDTTAPNIIVNRPLVNKTYGRGAPQFIIEIHDLNFNSCWYRIEGWSNNFTIKSNGTINQIAWQSVWDSIKSGDVITITFFANDTLNHLSSVSIGLKKYEPLIKADITFYSVIISIFMISIVISVSWSLRVILKKSSFIDIMKNTTLKQLITKYKFRDMISTLLNLWKNSLRGKNSLYNNLKKKALQKRK